jgi:hypothetical protein
MRTRDISVKVCRTWEEAETADREFWRNLSPEDRILQTWRLSEELWRLKGRFPNESRLSRHVTRVVRG